MVPHCLGIQRLSLWIEFIQLSRRCDITEAEESLGGRESAAGWMRDKQMKKMQMEKSYLEKRKEKKKSERLS